MVRCSIRAGRTPKLTTSLSESSSFPMSEYASSARAARPSRKSKTAAASIMQKAMSGRSLKVNITPMTPQRRFMEVMLFGIALRKAIT